MFESATSFNSPIGSWNTNNLVNLKYMFQQATAFNQDLLAWNLSNVIDFSGIFYLASSFNGDISSWDLSNALYTVSMFQNAVSFNQNISNWNVSNVEDMGSMFRNSTSFNQDIGSWNVSKVESMGSMFLNATNFNQDISNWDVSNVVYMTEMFYNATTFNQDVSNWNVSSVISLNAIFYEALAFDQNLGAWNVSNAPDLFNMLSFSGLSVSNYDSTLIGWESQGIIDKSLGAVDLRYCASDSIRNNLINLNGWTITGDIIDNISCETVATTSLNAFEVFEIYPNPTKGQFFINAEFEQVINEAKIEIFNTKGQIIKTINLGNQIDRIQEHLDLSALPKGSYYVLIRSELEQIGKMILLN